MTKNQFVYLTLIRNKNHICFEIGKLPFSDFTISNCLLSPRSQQSAAYNSMIHRDLGLPLSDP